MLPGFAADTVTVVEPALVDDRGTLVPDWSAPPASQTPVEGCLVLPGASVEVLAGRQAVAVRWTVYAPPDVVLTAHSAVSYQGRLYQVDGEPARWPSPTGGLDHVVILLLDPEG